MGGEEARRDVKGAGQAEEQRAAWEEKGGCGEDFGGRGVKWPADLASGEDWYTMLSLMNKIKARLMTSRGGTVILLMNLKYIFPSRVKMTLHPL
jgi:hypothetical protein